MDTKDGEYETPGGWQWDGNRWVPVTADQPANASASDDWPPAEALAQPDDPDPANSGTTDSATTTHLPTVHPPQSVPPAQSMPPVSSPPVSSAPPGGYPQQRIHNPVPPGFEPEDFSGRQDPAAVSPALPPGGPVSPGPVSSSAPPAASGPPFTSGPVYQGEVVSGPVSPGPATPDPAYGGAGYYGSASGAPPSWEAPPTQPYSGSGLTAADLRWNTEREAGNGRIWRLVGAVVAVIALLTGAAAGGYLVRDLRGGAEPRPEPTAETATPGEIQKALTAEGFECTSAFTRPVAIDLCFRETTEYSESVGFQMIDNNRAGWLRLRVEAAKPARNPVKERALKLFGSVIDQAVPKRDAAPARSWLTENLPDNYQKNEYLEHEAGGVGLKLLPRSQQWALLWVRLNAASYRHIGDPTLDRATSQSVEQHYRDDGFNCRPSEGGVNCEKQADPATMTVTYQVRDGRIAFMRLSAAGELKAIAVTAREHTVALLGLVMAGSTLDTARTWLGDAFDEQPHHTVLSGTEIRVTPVREPTGTRYDVIVNPANW